MKRILVACGTAIATSTVVAKKIEEVFKSKGHDVQVDQCKASEAPSKAANFDLIVATTPVGNVGGTPVIQSISFLTGIGMEEDIKKIFNELDLEY
ncbi:PTS sugar transporter subunit IIB [Salinicoccus sesuvii]|uniref:PTS sugar transporter subunit IIB n=1 Tax=Salinicoccus sesuvii TaxID=868281 RepID=A0ABV7N2I2_9STAP